MRVGGAAPKLDEPPTTDLAAPGNRFCAAYGVRYPIASAAMAFVASTPDLAIAVSNAGGLGAIGSGILTPAALRESVAAFRAATTQPLHLNFVTILASDETIALVEELRADIVSFHWGHPPRPWIDRLHASGAKVWEQVGSAEAARRAADDGIDLLIVQGREAGGHNLGELPLLPLLGAVRAAIGPEPLLLAAGGIVDGAGLVRALAAGADGVVVGSRFVASEEADAHPAYKQAIVAGSGEETVLTSIFGRDLPQFNPMRVIRNAIVRESEHHADASDAEAVPVGTIVIGTRIVPIDRFSSFVPTRYSTVDIEQVALLAGCGIGGIRDVRPVSAIIGAMMREATAYLADARASPGFG